MCFATVEAEMKSVVEGHAMREESEDSMAPRREG